MPELNSQNPNPILMARSTALLGKYYKRIPIKDMQTFQFAIDKIFSYTYSN